jgi:hypothetical protein
MIGGSGLDDFSEKYDEAVNYLRSEYFITLDADDKWKTHERKKKKSKKLTVIRRSKDKISCLYIIEFEEGCKIGISSNVKNRMRDYKKPWCKRIERSYIVHHESPLDVENHLKRCFKDVRHRGEFYYCEPSVFFRELEAAYPMNPVENFLH